MGDQWCLLQCTTRDVRIIDGTSALLLCCWTPTFDEPGAEPEAKTAGVIDHVSVDDTLRLRFNSAPGSQLGTGSERGSVGNDTGYFMLASGSKLYLVSVSRNSRYDSMVCTPLADYSLTCPVAALSVLQPEVRVDDGGLLVAVALWDSHVVEIFEARHTERRQGTWHLHCVFRAGVPRIYLHSYLPTRKLTQAAPTDAPRHTNQVCSPATHPCQQIPRLIPRPIPSMC